MQVRPVVGTGKAGREAARCAATDVEPARCAVLGCTCSSPPRLYLTASCPSVLPLPCLARLAQVASAGHADGPVRHGAGARPLQGRRLTARVAGISSRARASAQSAGAPCGAG